MRSETISEERHLPVIQERSDGPGRRRTRSGFDLNGHALTRFLLTNPYVQPTLQVPTIGIFGLALWQAFAGSQEGGRNFAAVVFFGLWWAPFMILTLILVGRVWCYICPIGAITQFLQRFSLNRPFPTYRKPKWRAFGVGFSVLSIAAVSFTLARLPLYKFGVATIPWRMGVYFLFFLTVAVALTLIFRQRVFCRYFCPATGVMSVTTRLSPVEIRQDRASHVPDCMTAEFRSPYLSTERRCVACMNCSTAQPEQAVRLRVRWPGAAAVRQRLVIPDEAVIALIVWAVFPIDHVLGSRVIAGMSFLQLLPPFLSKSLPYFASIAATILVFALVNRVAAGWSGLDPRESFTRFAFAYVPLGIGFQLGVHAIAGLLENGGGLLNAFAAGLGIPLNLPAALAAPDTVAAWSYFSVTSGLWLTALWGAAIAWFVARDLAETRGAALKAALPHLLLMAASTHLVVGHMR